MLVTFNINIVFGARTSQLRGTVVQDTIIDTKRLWVDRQITIHPICTPQLLNSYTCALDVFPAAETYDLMPQTDLGPG